MSENPLILIIDDEAAVRDFVRVSLKNGPYALVFAENGKEGLRLFQELSPALVLLDLRMPELDGLSVLEALKPKPTDAYSVIIFTGVGDDTAAKACYDMGISFFLRKPFGKLELQGLVKKSIELKSLQNDLAEKNAIITAQSGERKELLHLLCHDLTNSVGSVVSLLDLAVEDPEFLAQSRADMVTTLRGSLEVINLVRKIRSLDDRSKPLRLEAFSLGDALSESVFILNHKFMEKQVVLSVDVEPGLMVYAERFSFVYSVLNTLLANAVKYSYPDSTVIVSGRSEGDRALLEVRDFGIGMPDAISRDLFDLSNVKSRSGTRGETGTGYGMPLTRKLIVAYGGEIHIDSRDEVIYPKDHGTTVKLVLRQPPPNGENAN